MNEKLEYVLEAIANLAESGPAGWICACLIVAMHIWCVMQIIGKAVLYLFS